MKTNLSHSEQITNGLRRSFRDENCKTANRVCYGYTIRPDGELAINEREARIVRWIFARYLNGDSFGRIAKELEKMNVASPSGKATWNREAISKLLSNEKHAGDSLLQKTYVPDIFTGKQKKNAGRQEKFLYRNNHEAFISREVFGLVQRMKGWHLKNSSPNRVRSNSR